MIKVSKYSIKSEAANHSCTIKKLFWRVLKISQKKNLCMSLLLNKFAGLYPDFFFFLKKRFLLTCFPVSFAKYFRALFLQNTSGWLLLQNILVFHVNFSHKMLALLFFPFYFKYFQSKHFSESPKQLAMTWRYNTKLIILILI